MKSTADLVKGWIRKAESDLANTSMCLARGQTLDAGCFHAQQAAEKYIKAFLTANHIDFPFIHDVERLLELCAQRDPSFRDIMPLGEVLTPYAVDLRYDPNFWPARETAREAYEVALKIKAFVLDRLPPELKQGIIPQQDGLKYTLAVLLPPAAVWLYGRRDQFILNVLLTLCFWLPGVIHALHIVRRQPVHQRLD